MSLLLRTTLNKCFLSAPGVKRVLITTADQVGGLLFSGSDFNTITGFSYPPGTSAFWLVFETATANTQLRETKEDTAAGVLYSVEFSSSVVRLSAENRQFFEELDSNNLLFIVEDNNGLLWLVGSPESPARVVAYEATTDTAGGVTGYTFTAAAGACQKLQRIDPALGASLPVLVTDCSIYAGSAVEDVPGPIGIYYNCFVNDFF